MFGIPAMASGLPSAMQTGGPLAITTHTTPTLVLFNESDVALFWEWNGKNPAKWAAYGATSETGPFSPLYETDGANRNQIVSNPHFQWWFVQALDAHSVLRLPKSNVVYLQIS